MAAAPDSCRTGWTFPVARSFRVGRHAMSALRGGRNGSAVVLCTVSGEPHNEASNCLLRKGASRAVRKVIRPPIVVANQVDHASHRRSAMHRPISRDGRLPRISRNSIHFRDRHQTTDKWRLAQLLSGPRRSEFFPSPLPRRLGMWISPQAALALPRKSRLSRKAPVCPESRGRRPAGKFHSLGQEFHGRLLNRSPIHTAGQKK